MCTAQASNRNESQHPIFLYFLNITSLLQVLNTIVNEQRRETLGLATGFPGIENEIPT